MVAEKNAFILPRFGRENYVTMVNLERRKDTLEEHLSTGLSRSVLSSQNNYPFAMEGTEYDVHPAELFGTLEDVVE